MTNAAVVLQRGFEAFVSGLRQRPGFDLPRHRFVHLGQLSYDSELLAVHSLRIYQGLPGSPRGGFQAASGGFFPSAMDVAVTIVRSAPLIDNAGRTPTGDQLSRASAQASADAAALIEVFNEAKTASLLGPPCDDIYFAGIDWVGPSGGLLGTMLTYGVQL